MSKRNHFQSIFILCGVLAMLSFARADVRTARLFSDHMVLQQGRPVPIWGWADAGSVVQVSFAGQTARTTTGPDGYWRVVLKPMRASAVGREVTIRSGREELRLENVVVGEVWIAAGQSNMNHSGPDKPTGLYPHHQSPGKPVAEVRRIRCGFGASLEPLADLDADPADLPKWQVLTSGDFGNTNLATFFARRVRDHIGMPVGVIHVAVSGTHQNAWMARETLEAFPGGGAHENLFQQEFVKLAGKDGERFHEFKRKEAEWRESGEGRWPGDSKILNIPTVLYNSRIHPLAPAAVRGVIWHQGEAGASGEHLVAQVRQWRERFGTNFHFIWGTLARDTGSVPTLTAAPEWFYRSRTNRSLRRAAGLFGSDDRSAMVELYDVGDHDTHFYQKAEAGRRMGLAAIRTIYGGDPMYTGPRLTGLDLEGGAAVATFGHVGDALRYEPSLGGVSGFYLKGKNTGVLWAEVEVTGPDTLRISHPDVEEVVSVGYGLAANPHETLFNSAGLPASPFARGFDRLPLNGQNPAPRILRVETGKGVKASLNLGHVRREGYTFQLIRPRRATGENTATLHAFIPAEWQGHTVRVGDRDLPTETVETDHGTFATFEAPIDSDWIVVAKPGQVDAIAKVRRY